MSLWVGRLEGDDFQAGTSVSVLFCPADQPGKKFVDTKVMYEIRCKNQYFHGQF